MLDFIEWKTGKLSRKNIYIYHIDVSKTIQKNLLYTSSKSRVEILSNVKQIHQSNKQEPQSFKFNTQLESFL